MRSRRRFSIATGEAGNRDRLRPVSHSAFMPSEMVVAADDDLGIIGLHDTMSDQSNDYATAIAGQAHHGPGQTRQSFRFRNSDSRKHHHNTPRPTPSLRYYPLVVYIGHNRLIQ